MDFNFENQINEAWPKIARAIEKNGDLEFNQSYNLEFAKKYLSMDPATDYAFNLFKRLINIKFFNPTEYCLTSI